MTLVSERCLSENWSLRLWGGRWTPTRNVAAEGIPVTSETRLDTDIGRGSFGCSRWQVSPSA